MEESIRQIHFQALLLLQLCVYLDSLSQLLEFQWEDRFDLIQEEPKIKEICITLSESNFF